MSPYKVYTHRNLAGQHSQMWGGREIEDEIAACGERGLLDVFVRHLPAGGKVLEGGCGLGAWVITLARRGYDVQGVDFDPAVIKRLNAYDPALKVSEQDICALKYPDGSFDAYISLGVIEHFERGPADVFKEMRRVLRRDGTLIITVPYNNLLRRLVYHPLRSVYYWVRKRGRNDVFFAEYRLTSKEFADTVTRNGFSIIETGWDDFRSPFLSMGLWADWPMLRSSRPYSLNLLGKAVSVLLSFSKRLTACGIYIVAKNSGDSARND